MTNTENMKRLENKVKAQAVTHLAAAERLARERLGERFDTASVYTLDGGTDVRQCTDAWLSVRAQRAWDANQIDDLRKCNLELAKRYAARAAS